MAFLKATPIHLLPERARILIKAIGAVLATALAAIATFQVVLLRKNDEPFRCFVKILRFQFAGHSS
jgi:hypothetical protein